MRVRVVTPPEPVISLEKAKAHLRVESEDDDALITDLIEAATAHIDGPDGWLGRALGRQSLELTLDDFRGDGCGVIRLPYPPLLEVELVNYVDPDGTEWTMGSTLYTVVGAHAVRPAAGEAWPAVRSFPDSVKIIYAAGYPLGDGEGAGSVIPAPIRSALLLMIGDLYANRETTAPGAASGEIQMSTTVEALLSPFRIWS